MIKIHKHAIVTVIVIGIFATENYSATVAQHLTNSDILSSHTQVNVAGIPR